MEATKPYEFRKLKSTDLFLMMKIIKKIGIDNVSDVIADKNIQNIFTGKQGKTEDDFYNIGKAMFGVAQLIIERLSDCENEIYEMLGATSNLTVKQIKDIDPNTFIDMIYDFVNKDDFMGFFKHVMALLNKNKK